MIVDLNPTDEQELIRDSIAQLLARALPIERLREHKAAGAASERAIWTELVDIGLFRFGLPEASGGIGYGLPEEVLAARAFGRHCVSLSVLATMLAAHVADAANETRVRDALMDGSERAAFANPLGGGEVQLLDATECTWLLMPGPMLQLGARAQATGSRDARSIDETLLLARVRVDAVQFMRADIAGRASLLLAAYLVGNAQATLDMAVAYAGVREQFGQPIGAFQAIKHSCADMAVRAAGAEAQTFYTAALSASSGGIDAEVACARWLAREAAIGNAKANIQIHGGMGFTAECDAHLFLKRALVVAALGSDSRAERKQILTA
jgi:alkylation response protein AidB-like acyl-CoA dehydrogenase